MIPFNPVQIAVAVGLIALGLCLASGVLRVADLLSGAGLMLGGSAGLAGYYGALVLKDWKPPTTRG